MFKKDSLAYLSGYQVIGQKKAGLSSQISSQAGGRAPAGAGAGSGACADNLAFDSRHS